MSKVQEIESALRELPPQEKWQVARWLLDELDGAAGGESVVEFLCLGLAALSPGVKTRRILAVGIKIDLYTNI